jgi:signal transduction histidine kinase
MEKLVYLDVEKNLKETLPLLSNLDELDVTCECKGLTVLADSLLKQIFYNLISNSQKHGEKVSKIRVSCQEKNEELEFIYEDNGVGISKAEKEKIFEEGYGKGTGYGLFLIRKMCEVYGWTIKEKSEHGNGARFIITIPKITKDGKEGYQCNFVYS